MPAEWDVDPDLYDPAEDPHRYTHDPDPISDGVGHQAFVARYVLDDCQEHFEESRLSRFPEVFDRYYFASTPPVLVDVLPADTTEDMEQQARLKRVAFKAEWCKANGWKYLAIGEEDAMSAQTVRERLHGAKRATVADRPAAKRPSKRAGGVERPRATVA